MQTKIEKINNKLDELFVIQETHYLDVEDFDIQTQKEDQIINLIKKGALDKATLEIENLIKWLKKTATVEVD